MDGEKERKKERTRRVPRAVVAAVIRFAIVCLLAAGCATGERHDGEASDAARNAGSSDAARNAGSAETESAASAQGADAGLHSPGSAAKAEDRTGVSESVSPEGERNRHHDKRGGGPQPQAGQLTAGEWSDLDDWEGWTDQLNGRDADRYRKSWLFFGFDRIAVQVMDGERPVADAEVTAISGKQPLWTARTDINGMAYLFPVLFDEDDQRAEAPNGYGIEVRAGQAVKRVGETGFSRNEPLVVDISDAPRPSETVDILFAIDTTGSMSDELQYLEEEVKDVIARVARDNGQQLDIRLSPNFYRDVHDDYVVRSFPFTRDVDRAVSQIAKQEASGGGDYPEAVEEALRDAIEEHEWSEEARARLLFLVLDAPPREEAAREIHRLTRRAAEEGIRIIPVASSGVDAATEYLLRFLAVSTGGTYLFLTDDSGIGNDHLEPAVGEYEVKLLNDLLVEVINRYGGFGKATL